jgi:hypothetical protein
VYDHGPGGGSTSKLKIDIPSADNIRISLNGTDTITTANGSLPFNTWSHVVFILDNVGDLLYLFIDGTQQGTVSSSQFSLPTGTGERTLIGEDLTTAGSGFTGYLANLIISGAYDDDSSLTSYYPLSGWANKTTPRPFTTLSAIDDEQSGYPYWFLTYKNTIPQIGGEYVDYTDLTEFGTVAKDTTDKKFVASFDFTSGYLKVGDDPAFSTPVSFTSSFTFDFWVYGTSALSGVIAHGLNEDNNLDFTFKIWFDAGVLKFARHRDSTGWLPEKSSTGALSTSSWHHCFVKYSSSADELEMWVDGVYQGTAVSDAQAVVAATTVFVGADHNGANNFNGRLEAFRAGVMFFTTSGQNFDVPTRPPLIEKYTGTYKFMP